MNREATMKMHYEKLLGKFFEVYIYSGGPT
jgi:hypothetical protein